MQQSQLPKVAMEHVMDFMSPRERIASATVSKQLAVVSQEPRFWRAQVQKDFGDAVESRVLSSPWQRRKMNEQAQFWKQIYLVEREQQLLEEAGIYEGLC